MEGQEKITLLFQTFCIIIFLPHLHLTLFPETRSLALLSGRSECLPPSPHSLPSLGGPVYLEAIENDYQTLRKENLIQRLLIRQRSPLQVPGCSSQATN